MVGFTISDTALHTMQSGKNETHNTVVIIHWLLTVRSTTAKLLTTCETVLYIISVMSMCLCTTYLCQEITLEKLDLGSSYLHSEYGSSSYMKVICSQGIKATRTKKLIILIHTMLNFDRPSLLFYKRYNHEVCLYNHVVFRYGGSNGVTAIFVRQ